MAPIGLVDRIDKATRLDAEPREGLAGGISLDGGHIGALAGIELERGLGTVNLQVDVRSRMAEFGQQSQWLVASVQADPGDVAVHDKHVVKGLLVRSDGEWLGNSAGIGLDRARGDTGLVQRQIVLGRELCRRSVDGLVAAEVEIAVEIESRQYPGPSVFTR